MIYHSLVECMCAPRNSLICESTVCRQEKRLNLASAIVIGIGNKEPPASILFRLDMPVHAG